LRVDLPCGLATLELFADDEGMLPVHHGRMLVPREPGLGI
jgi:hypothetical protein